MAAAFGWGTLAGSSLVIGAVVALRFRIGLRAIGLIMGFGAGVLISALAFDLVDEAVDESSGGGWVVGGLFAGYGLFQDSPPDTVGFVLAFAAGAILTMLAQNDARGVRARRQAGRSCDDARIRGRVRDPHARLTCLSGAFLCADSHCKRYRTAARRPQMIDTVMSHIGFRCTRPADHT